jgi:hypothetical protein
MIDARELELLRASALNHHGDGRELCVTAHGCAFSCCGRGWQRRDGYMQIYRGWVDCLHIPVDDDLKQRFGTFMLYSPGIGTLSYVVAMRFDEVELVEEVSPPERS